MNCTASTKHSRYGKGIQPTDTTSSRGEHVLVILVPPLLHYSTRELTEFFSSTWTSSSRPQETSTTRKGYWTKPLSIMEARPANSTAVREHEKAHTTVLTFLYQAFVLPICMKSKQYFLPVYAAMTITAKATDASAVGSFCVLIRKAECFDNVCTLIALAPFNIQKVVSTTRRNGRIESLRGRQMQAAFTAFLFQSRSITSLYPSSSGKDCNHHSG